MTPDKPSITVLIPAYNAADFLHRAVESALNQSYPPTEVLIVNDGSTDRTVEVVHGLQKNDGRIRIISLAENRGPSFARNAGLDSATCDWIALLDADDVFTPDCLQTFVQAIEGSADIVAGNFEYYSTQMDRTFPSGIDVSDALENVDIYKFVEHSRPYGTQADWGLLQPMYNKNFLNRHGLRYAIKSRHGEDFLFMAHALLCEARFILSHRVTYLYTDSYSGHSRTHTNYDAMWVHCEELMTSPDVAANKRLVRLLKTRVHQLKRKAAEHQLDYQRRNKNFALIIWRTCTNKHMFVEIMRRLMRKISFDKTPSSGRSP